jgi:hypothetical protein
VVVWLAIWLLAAIVGIYTAATVSADRARIHTRLRDAVRRRYRQFRPLPPTVVGPPIEQIAANLRRLQAWLDIYADPEPLPGKATKLAATTIAYDRVLGDACRALEISESIAETEGIDREAERLRLQYALADAGMVLRSPRRTGS